MVFIIDYTILEISEVPHWCETFQVLVRLKAQPEVLPIQVPVPSPAELPDFSVPPPPVNTDISHQQAEINRLMLVAQQWSTEVMCQYNQAPTHYNQDRFSTNTDRGRSISPYSTQNMLPAPHSIRTSRQFDELEQQRYDYYNGWFEPDGRRYSQASSNANNDSTSIMINASENFTHKISVQPLAQAALRSIQEFDGNDKVATIAWLD